MDMTAFGQRLLEFREHYGMTTRDFAKKLGISAGFYSQLENGKSKPTLKTLDKISKALGIGAQSLLCNYVEADKRYLVHKFYLDFIKLPNQDQKLIKPILESLTNGLPEYEKHKGSDLIDKS